MRTSQLDVTRTNMEFQGTTTRNANQENSLQITGRAAGNSALQVRSTGLYEEAPFLSVLKT